MLSTGSTSMTYDAPVGVFHHPSEETQVGDRARHVEGACEGERLAGVGRLGGGELVGFGLRGVRPSTHRDRLSPTSTVTCWRVLHPPHEHSHMLAMLARSRVRGARSGLWSASRMAAARWRTAARSSTDVAAHGLLSCSARVAAATAASTSSAAEAATTPRTRFVDASMRSMVRPARWQRWQPGGRYHRRPSS